MLGDGRLACASSGAVGDRGRRPPGRDRFARQADRPGGLAAADLIAALAHAALGDDDSTGPALGTGQAAQSPRSCSLTCPSPPGSRSFPARLTVRGSALPPASSRSTTSGTPATTPPSRPTTRENARARPTGTASPIAASPTPATPPTGFAGSANIPSSNRSPRQARPLLDRAWRLAARRPLDLRRCLERDRHDRPLHPGTAGHARRDAAAPASAPGDVALARGDLRGDRRVVPVVIDWRRC